MALVKINGSTYCQFYNYKANEVMGSPLFAIIKSDQEDGMSYGNLLAVIQIIDRSRDFDVSGIAGLH